MLEEEIDLSVAGIHGTIDVKCERFTVGLRGKARCDTHHMTVYTHPNIDAGKKIYNYQERKLAPFFGSKRRKIDTQTCTNHIGPKLLPYTSAARI